MRGNTRNLCLMELFSVCDVQRARGDNKYMKDTGLRISWEKAKARDHILGHASNGRHFAQTVVRNLVDHGDKRLIDWRIWWLLHWRGNLKKNKIKVRVLGQIQRTGEERQPCYQFLRMHSGKGKLNSELKQVVTVPTMNCCRHGDFCISIKDVFFLSYIAF